MKSIEGKGSEFTVKLPVSNLLIDNDPRVEYIIEDGDNQCAEINESNDINNNGMITILVVEDNSELRIFMKNFLSKDNNGMLSNNGKEGYEKARNILPDLIISYVIMPVMDRLYMVKKIKEDSDICHIPILLLSAKTSLDNRIKGLEYGIDDYIPKPFNTKYLLTRIQTLIAQRNELKEYYLELFNNSSPRNTDDLNLSEPIIVNKNDKFIKRFMELIEENIGSTDIKIEFFAEKLSASLSVLYNKVKSIIGLSPVEFAHGMLIK